MLDTEQLPATDMNRHGEPDITADQAEEIARVVVAENLDPADPVFSQWAGATVGLPVLVSSISKKPSYFLVPLMKSPDIIGFIRIDRSGTVIQMGNLAAGTGRSRTITGISRHEAEKRALSMIDARTETISPAVFIHDGPVGRETWFIEVCHTNTPTRWLFVSDAGIYERPAGSLLAEDLE